MTQVTGNSDLLAYFLQVAADFTQIAGGCSRPIDRRGSRRPGRLDGRLRQDSKDCSPSAASRSYAPPGRHLQGLERHAHRHRNRNNANRMTSVAISLPCPSWAANPGRYGRRRDRPRPPTVTDQGVATTAIASAIRRTSAAGRTTRAIPPNTSAIPSGRTWNDLQGRSGRFSSRPPA